jgi:cell division protease FtsH
VAEQVVFGAVTTGAADDLRRVADITHAMVHEYAMGTAPETSSRAIIDPEAVSDLTRRIGDEEQQHLAFEAHRAAFTLITRHRTLLESFARALLDREVLERSDIDRLMDGVPRIDRRIGPRGLRVAAASRIDLGPGSG